MGIPKAPWTKAIRSKRDASRYLPQAIAHRGYKESWPENTMAAFKGAAQIGAHAVETDVRLSADGVVVLSHDPSLKRCFGIDAKIADCSWNYLSTLKTTRKPSQGLPRLIDLLSWLAEPAQEGMWVLLDIKMDDEPNALLGAMAEAVAQAPKHISWPDRIILGCWNATFIETSRRILPAFPLAHITVSLSYARHFLPVPNLGFNMLQLSLVGPLGSCFLRDVREADRPVFVWTVNKEKWMRWCIQKNAPKTAPSSSEKKRRLSDQASTRTSSDTICPAKRGEAAAASSAMQGVRLIDGVITDNPKLFLEVCDRWEDELDGLIVPRRAGLRRSLIDCIVTLLQLLTITALEFVVLLKGRFVDGNVGYLKDPKALQ